MTDSIDRVLYKQTQQGDLHLHVFHPQEIATAAIVFFVCGGWNGFYVQKFFPQSTYFSRRGVVCAVAEVRTIEKHGTRPHECVIDAKSALRYVRSQAHAWQFPVDRLVAAGGSAAGHVSLSSAMIEGYEDEQDAAYPYVSSKPNLVCAYNPAVLPPLDIHTSSEERIQARLQKFGGEAELMKLSPYQAIGAGLPPILLLHGDSDDVTPLTDTENFHKAMRDAGNDCELIVYPDAGHGFFNYNPDGNVYFDQTTRHIEEFLLVHDFMTGESTFADFIYQAP